MALNLNKNEGENQTPLNEKKGLNLSKSEEPKKEGLNLNKSDDSSKLSLNLNKSEEPKKGGLNLNKSEDSSKESLVVSESEEPKKGGLNLNKSEDSSKTDTDLKKTDNTTKGGIDLSKDKINTESNSTNSENQNEPKKKSPFMLIAIIAIAALGIFWFINRGNNESPVEEPAPVVNDTSSIQTPQVIDTTKTETPTTATDLGTTSADPSGSTATSTNNVDNVPAGKSTGNDSGIETRNNPNTNGQENPVLQGTTEDKANKVLRGEFGVGIERKRALGSDYPSVQAKVNEMYRNKRK